VNSSSPSSAWSTCLPPRRVLGVFVVRGGELINLVQYTDLDLPPTLELESLNQVPVPFNELGTESRYIPDWDGAPSYDFAELKRVHVSFLSLAKLMWDLSIFHPMCRSIEWLATTSLVFSSLLWRLDIDFLHFIRMHIAFLMFPFSSPLYPCFRSIIRGRCYVLVQYTYTSAILSTPFPSFSAVCMLSPHYL